MTYFSHDKRFVVDDKVDAALVDAVLWWRGAGKRIKNDGFFFDTKRSWIFPYGDLNKLVT